MRAAITILAFPSAAAFAAGHILTPNELSVLQSRAERHDQAAETMLGSAYLHGDGVTADPAQAAVWFERAAVEGDDLAQELLAKLYEDGKGVPQNLTLAADWREKSAKRGNQHAQYLLGRMYLDGRGVTKSKERARYWIHRAAVEGDDDAATLLRELDRADGSASSKSHATTSLSWSALKSYATGVSLENLIERVGYRMREGFSHHKPDLHKLAKDGDPEAEYRLAQDYERGRDGEHADRAEALKWFRAAAEHGHVGARSVLKDFARTGKLNSPEN